MLHDLPKLVLWRGVHMQRSDLLRAYPPVISGHNAALMQTCCCRLKAQMVAEQEEEEGGLQWRIEAFISGELTCSVHGHWLATHIT